MKEILKSKRFRIVTASVLCVVVIIVSVFSCRNSKNIDLPDSTLFENNISSTPQPTITLAVVDNPSNTNDQNENVLENEEIDEIINSIDNGEIDDVYALVCSTVTYKLQSAGFTTETCVAKTVENDNYTGIGIGYYDDEIKVFSDQELIAAGFVEIVDSSAKYANPSQEDTAIYLSIVDGDNTDEEIQLICAYNYNDIGSSHFIYKEKYIKYYQQTPMRVVYDIYENELSNYDLSLGSLYDYDKKRFVYDESIFGEYNTHSAVKLFSNEDYEKLEKDLQELSKAQEKAGYVVEEYSIVYISPESLQAYLDSEEEDTFFGYGVDELTEAFGVGNALEFTENGLISKVVEESAYEYNWKGFLTKYAIGCGIIIVGAVLTPITGGTSFGCALVTITSLTASAALSAGLGSLAIETIDGLIAGKDMKDALREASYKGLDTFANTFIIAAAVTSVGVASGLIKPVACFTADTLVAVDFANGDIVFDRIENICENDYVLSIDTDSMAITKQRVSKTMSHIEQSITYVYIGDQVITTTPLHPFYCIDMDGWKVAEKLAKGDKVLCVDGDIAIVDYVKTVSVEEGVQVYNFTVENNHDYFVGEKGILVHNDCDIIKKMRSQSVKDAWKKEIEAVKNGTSKYNWTSAEKRQLLELGKVKGYEGHHIIPVKELVGTVKESLIGSADDIVFLQKNVHKIVHRGGDTLDATKDILIQYVPWVADKLKLLLIG